jgi:methyl-accepting chemotaxis protein
MLLIRYFFRRDLGSNLDRIGQQLERVRAGDLTVRIGSSEQLNEIVKVANGLDFLVDHLADTIRKTDHISGTLRHSVDQTKTVMDRLIEDARKQQQSMEESFQLLSDASESQSQIIEHTSRLQEMAQTNSDALSGIKGTFEGIVNIIDSLNDSMTTLHSSIKEFSHSSRGVAGIAEEAAETVNEVAAAMIDINATVKEINDVVHASTELSNMATESISSKGIASVGNAIDTTRRIESFFNSLSETIIRLDTKSNDIAKILNAIHEVTDQVNLLSLNALIIAAQSGESGNSFIVVAREMKLLAGKAGQSAKEIESIVSSIQHEIAAAVSETKETALAVNEGKSVAASTGEVLDEILELSSRSTGLIQEIAVSTGKQNRMVESVNRDIKRLLEMNNRIKTATGEEEVSTDYLMKAANRISASLSDTRNETEEQFRSLQLIEGNIREANIQLDDIARRSSGQQTVNLGINRSMEGNLVTAEAMVAAVQKVGEDVGGGVPRSGPIAGGNGFFPHGRQNEG